MELHFRFATLFKMAENNLHIIGSHKNATWQRFYAEDISADG